ncbi:MAG: MFS transporter [Pseudomonadota bacterium]
MGDGRARLILGVCFLMAFFAWGTVFYGNGVYLVALRNFRDWSIGDISLGIGLFFIAGVPATLVHGALVDRFGPRWIVAYGAVSVGGGIAMLGVANSLYVLYAVMFVLGTGYPALATPLVSATLLPWFRDNYGWALSLALTGASVGGAVLVPVMVHAIERWGFPATTLATGAIVLVVLLPLAILVLTQPGLDDVERPTVFAPDVLRDGEFWRLSLACALGLGVQVGFLMHHLAILERHMAVEMAAYAVSAAVIAAAIGRLVFGYLSRWLALHVLTAMAYVMQACGIGWLALAWADWQRLAASVLAGFSIGAIVMLPALLVRHRFGPARYGRAYAAVNVALYSLAGISPALVGFITDRLGSYAPSLLLLFAIQVIAASLIGARAVAAARDRAHSITVRSPSC